MKNKIVIILSTIFIFFFVMPFVLAETSGTGGIGDVEVGGASGSGSWNSNKFGFYIAVYNSENKKRGDVKLIEANKVNALSNWIYKKGEEWVSNPTILYNYLNIPYEGKEDDYSNLIKQIPVKKLNTGDYILIEPVTQISGSWISFRGIVNKKNEVQGAPFYEWYNKPALILANAAKVGTNITVGNNKYTAQNSNCTRASYRGGNFCGYKANKYIGYGITVVSYKQIYAKLTITKKDSDTKKEISGVEFNLYSGSGCKSEKYITTKSTNSNGKITFDDLKAGTYSIYERTIPDGYKTPTDRCTTITISAGKESTKTIYNTPSPKKGSMTIIKKDYDTKKEISGVEFNLYSGSGCKSEKYITTKSTDSNGEIPFEDLKAGTYSIYEKTIPYGYKTPTNRCTTITVSVGKKSTKTIYNYPKDACEFELEKINNQYRSLDNNKRNALVILYRDLIASGDGEHKGLLNFTSPSCGGSTCSTKADIGCLSANFSKSSNFSADNISCFDSTIESDGKIVAYCQTKFIYTSNYANAFKNKTISIDSGKKFLGVLYPFDDTEKIIGNGIVTKTCYSYGTSNLSGTFVDSNKYSDYIGLIKFNDKELESNVGTLNSLTLKRSTINPYEYIGTNQASYYFPAIYALNGSGEVTKTDGYYLTKNDCETSIDGKTTTYYTCKFLGYGVISKFLDVGEINIPFSIKLKGSLKGLVSNDMATASCTYNATPKIIINDKLRLVFRTINTNVSNGLNAFLDKLGNVRDAKSNWKDKEDIITTKNNSYNKNGDGPKYTIELAPSDIKNIRKYNKKTSYDDYTLYCDENGENCKSRFLDGLQSGTLKFYNTKTNRVDGSWTIQNKLTIDESIVLN